MDDITRQEKISELATIAYHEAMKSKRAINNIQMTIINIKIAVAKSKDQEAKVLDVISDRIAEELKIIEESAKKAGSCMTEIAELNK